MKKLTIAYCLLSLIAFNPNLGGVRAVKAKSCNPEFLQYLVTFY